MLIRYTYWCQNRSAFLHTRKRSISIFVLRWISLFAFLTCHAYALVFEIVQVTRRPWLAVRNSHQPILRVCVLCQLVQTRFIQYNLITENSTNFLASWQSFAATTTAAAGDAVIAISRRSVCNSRTVGSSASDSKVTLNQCEMLPRMTKCKWICVQRVFAAVPSAVWIVQSLRLHCTSCTLAMSAAHTACIVRLCIRIPTNGWLHALNNGGGVSFMCNVLTCRHIPGEMMIIISKMYFCIIFSAIPFHPFHFASRFSLF